MVTTARGAAYDPSPVPQSGGEAALRQWADKEHGRIATAIKQGRVQFLSLDVLHELPAKPFAGMVAFFAAGVATATEGMHEYRSSGAWSKL
jgi:hypothetical protein